MLKETEGSSPLGLLTVLRKEPLNYIRSTLHVSLIN